MATVLESLKGVNAYPVPLRTLTGCGERRGLLLDSQVTETILEGAAYNLAVADILLWLSLAPDISQGGQSYSFSEEQRVQLRSRANALYGTFGDAADSLNPKPVYGYKGSRL